MERAELRIRSTIIQVSTFGQTADADQNQWTRTLTGLVSATLRLSGPWDNDSTKYTAAARTRPGLAATTPTFTLASGVAFSFSGYTEEVGVMGEVDRAVMFDATIVNDGAVTYP